MLYLSFVASIKPNPDRLSHLMKVARHASHSLNACMQGRFMEAP
jgi:hypothetical protein